MQTSSAGSGVQLPLAAQTDIICCDGASPGLHWKNICEPSNVLTDTITKPFIGEEGSPQSAGMSRVTIVMMRMVMVMTRETHSEE